MNTKIVLGVIALGAVLGTVAFFGYSPFIKVIKNFGGTAPTGSTYTNSNVQNVVINTATAGANGTSTTITNTSGYDRFVTGFRFACQNVGSSFTAYTGAGLAAWQLSIGTTSTVAPATTTFSNPIAVNLTLSTSTLVSGVASSTLQTATSSLALLWRSGENLTFFLNATNTATCSGGVDSIGS